MARRRRSRSRARRHRRNIPFPNPRRRRRSRARRNIPFPNPRRRRGGRRHRRNPILPSGMQHGFQVALYTTAGFVGTKVAAGFVLPMLGELGQNSLVRLAGKAGVAYGTAWLGSMILGRSVFTPLLVGGLVETLNEGIKTFVAPYVPLLAAYEMYELPDRQAGMGTYPDSSLLGTYPGGYETNGEVMS